MHIPFGHYSQNVNCLGRRECILYTKRYCLGFPEKPAVSFLEELVSFCAHFLSLSDSGRRQILGPQPHVDTKTARQKPVVLYFQKQGCKGTRELMALVACDMDVYDTPNFWSICVRQVKSSACWPTKYDHFAYRQSSAKFRSLWKSRFLDGVKHGWDLPNSPRNDSDAMQWPDGSANN